MLVATDGVIETFIHFLKHFCFIFVGNCHFRNYEKLVKFQKAFKSVALAAESKGQFLSY